jgi:hypothetical protein
MSNKVTPSETWIKVNAIRIKACSVNEHGIYLRIYFDFKGKEVDMFPLDNDFFLGKAGTLNIIGGKKFKMKTKVEIT